MSTTPTAPVTANGIELKIRYLMRLLEELWEKFKAWVGDATVRTAIRTRLDSIEQSLELLKEKSWSDYTALSDTLDNMTVAVEKQIEGLSDRNIDFVLNELSKTSEFLQNAKSNEAGEITSPEASFDIADILKDFGPIHNIYQKGGRALVEGENKTKVLRITNGTITEGEEDAHRSYVIEAEDVSKPATEIMANDQVGLYNWRSWIEIDKTTAELFLDDWNNLINNPAPSDKDIKNVNDSFRAGLHSGIRDFATETYGEYGQVLTNDKIENIEPNKSTKMVDGKMVTIKAFFTKGHLTLTDDDTKTDSIEVSFNPVNKSIVGTYCVTGSSETQNIFSVVNIGSDDCTMRLNLPDPSFADKWLMDNTPLSNFLSAHGVSFAKFQEVVNEACQNPGVNDFTHVSEENYVKLEALEEGLKKRFHDDTLDFFLKKSDLIERKGFDEKVNVSFLRVTDSLRDRSYLISFNESGEAKSIYERQTVGDTERFIEVPKETSGIFRSVKAVEKDIANRESALQNPQPQRNTPTSAKQPNEQQRQQ